MRNSLRAIDGCFLPPLEPEWMSTNDLHQKTIRYTTWFALPTTHRLRLRERDHPELAAFLIGTLGVLKGLQLVLDGWGHFYRTPIAPGMLTDVVPAVSAIVRVLESAYGFWDSNPAVGRLLFGAIHWHLFGCSYLHGFEKFATRYSVLDTCWRVHALKNGINDRSVAHAERIVQLSAAYDLSLPKWAVVRNRKSVLSELRNEYFHESRWGGAPIGVAHPTEAPDIDVELFYFNTRLLLAMLGERTDYTRSRFNFNEWHIA